MRSTPDALREQYCTPFEFAALLEVSPETVQTWVRDGRLPAVRLGKLTLIPRDALERLLESGLPGRGEASE